MYQSPIQESSCFKIENHIDIFTKKFKILIKNYLFLKFFSFITIFAKSTIEI